MARTFIINEMIIEIKLKHAAIIYGWSSKTETCSNNLWVVLKN
jgi:hypothetical protein